MEDSSKPIILKKGEGRKYNMGSMQAIFFIPGGFERNMPSIVKWFDEKR